MHAWRVFDLMLVLQISLVILSSGLAASFRFSARGNRGFVTSGSSSLARPSNHGGCIQMMADLGKASSHSEELFSVAPMMAHTNRHWHYFFRMLSSYATLYTEMTHAEDLVRAARDKPTLLHEYAVRDGHTGPVVLQLGGADPETLAAATRIGAQLGYNAINLNCGCPSMRAHLDGEGAALMSNASHVAECCRCMMEAVSDLPSPPPVTVKHRLGIADRYTYDRANDLQLGDGPALESASDFIETVSAVGVRRFHVHARLALLDFDFNPDSGLHVPHRGRNIQEACQKSGRKGKGWINPIGNRDVPPLRMSVAHTLAEKYPQLDIIANGGIDSIESARAQLRAGCAGAMVGRAAINHPCAFAEVDSLWSAGHKTHLTRGEILEKYMDYCDEEEQAAARLPRPLNETEDLRTKPEELTKQLVQPAFNLFAGMAGVERYHRSLQRFFRHAKSLRGCPVNSARASTILKAAASELPPETLSTSVNTFIPASDLKVYEKATKKSSPLQRLIS